MYVGHYKIFKCNADDKPVFSLDMSDIVVEAGKTYSVPDKTQPIKVDKYGIHFTPDLRIACLFGMPLDWPEPFYVARVNAFPMASHKGSYLIYASNEITVQKLMRIDSVSEFAQKLSDPNNYEWWFRRATTGTTCTVSILELFLREKGF